MKPGPGTTVTVMPTPGDPPVKSNGRCVVCNKPRPVVAVAYSDPFCSTSCCRTWHGTRTEAVPTTT